MKAFLTTAEYEACSPEVKARYSPGNGGYMLVVEAAGGFGIFRDPSGIRSELETAQAAQRAAAAELAQAVARAAAAEAAAAAAGQGGTPEEREQELERRVASVRDALQARAAAAEASAAKMKDSALAALRRAHIQTVLSDPKIRGNSLLLEPILAPAVEVELTEEGRAQYYVTEGGVRRLSAEGNGHMPLSEYIQTVVKKDERFAPCFAPERANGAGHHGDADEGGNTLAAEAARYAKEGPTRNLTKLGELYEKNPGIVGPIARANGIPLN